MLWLPFFCVRVCLFVLIGCLCCLENHCCLVFCTYDPLCASCVFMCVIGLCWCVYVYELLLLFFCVVGCVCLGVFVCVVCLLCVCL